MMHCGALVLILAYRHVVLDGECECVGVASRDNRVTRSVDAVALPVCVILSG